MKKFLNEKNLILLISFFIIIFIFINFTHNSSKFKRIDGVVSIDEKQNAHNSQWSIGHATPESTYKKLNGIELKKEINKELISDETYSYVLNKECDVNGSMHERHKVRWVKALLLKNIFEISNNLNSKLPYYTNIILHSLIIFLTLLILNQTFQLQKKFIIFFLLYITFIFQNHLGEYSYSVFEMFFLSTALYASKRKYFILFVIVTLLAALNRESGFIIILSWLIFNKEIKKILICFILVIGTFLLINFEAINCIIKPKFFIPLEGQPGQMNFSDLKNTSLISSIKVLIINFIIPFGIIFYNLIKYKIKNNYLILITIIYLLTFLIATPLHHMAAKLIILPLVILSFFPNELKRIN